MFCFTVHALRREYASEGEADRSEYNRTGPRKMAHAHEKVEGIGPTTKDGMPVALRSVSMIDYFHLFGKYLGTYTANSLTKG